MEQSLFRQEALDAANRGNLGIVALYCPPYRWLVISVVVLITAATALFFIFGSYTKYESSTGELLPKNGMLIIPPPVSATVVDIPVKEGQHVEKDDVLMVLSSEVSTQLGQTRQVIAENLKGQRERLQQDLVTLEKLHQVEMKGLTDTIASLKLQQEQLKLQLTHRRKQVSLAKMQLDKLEAMHNEGYASSRQMEEQESNLLDSQARYQEYQRQLLDISQKIVQTEQQLHEKPLDDEKKRNDIERQLADNRQSMAENEARRSFELRAPKSGYVGMIMVKNGQMITAGQSAIAVLPSNTELVARIMVNTQSIGFIQPGQRVVLRYKAFPYQKFGQQYGKVIEVSRTALSPQEVTTLTGKNNIQEQQYRVLVSLDKQSITAYAQNEKLKPGMALDADFIVDKRRLYEWVLEPIFALGHKISL
ncbi:HlyD family efflux transporter periplasmic adaptor subunit [Pantoea agglomerans]|uniref:HlyD family efflux transporter periplasmic adaptor subunit n=1 Tax=Enterobacter agglomerans TaxID=549 RepID=A0A7X2MQD6_ENTAG|nr:HlyD family efflux transporter periplasmic adaptor subunit [Pantoea agglomerans]KEY40187.1 type I secretion membrane fusion protein [Pantoea agglomerans]MSE17411.1 HlyD family efflux transporter periplasmic adaptor subunit [Pantoea agglomerans]QAV47358.1 HlyD family efflux transporter periplasmic adaptor subunit [Pantoea agglomerans]QAV52111.1 HlyD family efflux transporter periplasmic adaptor subunit [Pantoea agglomerans]